MNITLNGVEQEVSDGASVTSLVSQVTGRQLAASGQAADGQRLGVAVARNSAVVPRSQWYAPHSPTATRSNLSRQSREDEDDGRNND